MFCTIHLPCVFEWLCGDHALNLKNTGGEIKKAVAFEGLFDIKNAQ